MDYYMNLVDCKFHISAKKFDACMEALRALANQPEKMGGCSWGNGVQTKHFAWEVYPDEATGDIVNIEFCGEKYGDDDRLFEALAPFVKRGSFVQMRGEDGAIWRWKFDGKTVKNQEGRVSFR